MKIAPAVKEIRSQTDRQRERQTDRPTDRNTPLPYRGGVITYSSTYTIPMQLWTQVLCKKGNSNVRWHLCKIWSRNGLWLAGYL